MILDLSAEQPNPPPPTKRTDRAGNVTKVPKARVRGGKVATRTPTGITLHQTWCWFGAKDDAARHRRALNVHAHWTCFRDGTAVLAYPLDWIVYHGNELNGTDVGIECEGMYEANGALRTPPAGVDVGRIVAAAREAITETVRRCPTVQYIHAHRQSSRSRANDPGAYLWHEVALWAVRECGLIAQPMLAIGDGQALEW